MRKDILVDGIVVGEYISTGDQEKDAEIVTNFLKEKGIYKKTSENDAMFRQANSFASVAKEIYQNYLREEPREIQYVSPFVVNAVFAVELYLKTIHNCYKNKIRGHHLSSLYKGMHKSGKKLFIEAAEDVRPYYQLHSGYSIFECLDLLNKSFEEWRYIYEHSSKYIELQAIRYTMHTSHEACSRIRQNVEKT